MPFKPNSPNAIPPAHPLTAFFFSVMFGASRFAHSDLLRADNALRAVLGIPRFPGTDPIRNFSSRFSQGAVESFWSSLWRWLLPHLAAPQESFSLESDERPDALGLPGVGAHLPAARSSVVVRTAAGFEAWGGLSSIPRGSHCPRRWSGAAAPRCVRRSVFRGRGRAGAGWSR